MEFRISLFFIAATVLLAVSCSGGDKTAVPRRHAYPRVELYDSVYVSVDSFPLHIELNSSVPVRSPRSGWIDVSYPRYGAVLHISALTFAHEELESEMNKRRERMAMNLYGLAADTEHMESDNGDFEAVVLTSRDAVATPLQFVATDGDRWLLSGAVYMPGVSSASPADSIAPVVEALHGDIVHCIKKLSHEPQRQ